mgnify:CR=1 FL=1
MEELDYEDNFAKFENMTVESNNEVYWAKTDEIVLEWKDQKFTIRIAENSKGGELIWMKAARAKITRGRENAVVAPRPLARRNRQSKRGDTIWEYL